MPQLIPACEPACLPNLLAFGESAHLGNRRRSPPVPRKFAASRTITESGNSLPLTGIGILRPLDHQCLGRVDESSCVLSSLTSSTCIISRVILHPYSANRLLVFARTSSIDLSIGIVSVICICPGTLSHLLRRLIYATGVPSCNIFGLHRQIRRGESKGFRH